MKRHDRLREPRSSPVGSVNAYGISDKRQANDSAVQVTATCKKKRGASLQIEVSSDCISGCPWCRGAVTEKGLVRFCPFHNPQLDI
jgi:hypothetical protein